MSFASASTDRIPARESREPLVALHTLGWTDEHLSRWLTSSDEAAHENVQIPPIDETSRYIC